MRFITSKPLATIEESPYEWPDSSRRYVPSRPLHRSPEVENLAMAAEEGSEEEMSPSKADARTLKV